MERDWLSLIHVNRYIKIKTYLINLIKSNHKKNLQVIKTCSSPGYHLENIVNVIDRIVAKVSFTSINDDNASTDITTDGISNTNSSTEFVPRRW